jgi:hypothetical protein
LSGNELPIPRRILSLPSHWCLIRQAEGPPGWPSPVSLWEASDWSWSGSNSYISVQQWGVMESEAAIKFESECPPKGPRMTLCKEVGPGRGIQVIRGRP